MNIKRLVSFGVSALLLSLASFVAINPGIVHAAGPFTCTWTGGGTDSNFSTAANWSGCNSAAPVAGDGDNLVFDNTSLSSSKTLNNDITSLQLGSITFQGTNSSFFSFTITGNALTVNSGITQSSNSQETLKLTVNLGADQTFSYSNGSLALGDFTNAGAQTLALGSHNLTLSGSTSCSGGFLISSILTGSGAFIDNVTDKVSLNADSPSYSGAIAVNSGSLFANTSQALGAASSGTTVASGASLGLGFSSDTTFAEPIMVSGTGVNAGGAITASDGGGSGCNGGSGSTTTSTATLSGNITLQGNTTVNPTQFHNITITGALSGNFTITEVSGAGGTLTINSSNDTSATPNGTSQSPPQTVTVASGDNQPNTSVEVFTNQTYTIDGTRGEVDVDSGGVLKGTGVLGRLFVLQGGTVAPGHSPGCLSTADLSLAGTYQAEIGGTTACTGYDQLTVTGTVDVTGATLNTTLYNGFKPAAGQTYTIISNDGTDPVTGTFTNLAEGATFNVSGYVFKITYKGGDGNDVVLSVVSVPAAPNTGFALAAAHPGATLGGTIALAGSILILARRSRKTATRRR